MWKNLDLGDWPKKKPTNSIVFTYIHNFLWNEDTQQSKKKKKGQKITSSTPFWAYFPVQVQHQSIL
jgi:hypothetical protein